MEKYKLKYDYPNARGEVVCTYCKFLVELPANYCPGCGQELEEYKKMGLSN